jgi:hypothetical protein
VGGEWWVVSSGWLKRESRYPPPRYFWKRGCKLLKTKDRGWKQRIKRLQAIEKARFRGGAAGRVSEVSSR